MLFSVILFPMRANPNGVILDQALSRAAKGAIAPSPFTVGDVATVLGISRATLSRKLNGKSALTAGEFMMFVTVVGTSAEELMRRAEAELADGADALPAPRTQPTDPAATVAGIHTEVES